MEETLKNKKRICVYCSSSNELPKKFYDFSKLLGEKIGKNGYDMVYGGTTIGMMGIIAENATKNGANVLGVIPECIVSLGLKNLEHAETIITKDMRERKAVMEKHSDVFVAVPGGFGTFEEIFEIIVAKQLNCHNKPIIFLNFDGYFNNLFKMFDTIYTNNFAKKEMKELYYITNNIEDLFSYIKTYNPRSYIVKY